MAISTISPASEGPRADDFRIPEEDFQVLKGRSPAPLFVSKDGELTSVMVTLLKSCGLCMEESHPSLAQAVAETQKAWVGVRLGQNNKERTDLKDTAERAALRSAVDTCANKLGLYNKREHVFPKYTYAVCHGAFLDGVRNNVAGIIKLWNDGVRFKSLVFLTGDRTLRKDREDSVTKLEDGSGYPLFKKGWKMGPDVKYDNEYDMVRLVWEQTELPEGMAAALKGSVVFINAPKPEGAERPGTKDTFREWLKTNPECGTIIASGRSVLWPYQQLVGETALRGTGFALDTVSSEVSQSELDLYKDRIVSIVLDTFAKCLFEIQEARKAEVPVQKKSL